MKNKTLTTGQFTNLGNGLDASGLVVGMLDSYQYCFRSDAAAPSAGWTQSFWLKRKHNYEVIRWHRHFLVLPVFRLTPPAFIF